MRKVLPLVIVFIFAVSILSVVFLPANTQAATTQDDACWGQASAVFAQMKTMDPPLSDMGAHASTIEDKRVGLANLARDLYDGGYIDEPTMQALGAFVASALELEIDACM